METISIKWLIAAVCVSLTAIVILIRALVASVDRHTFQEEIRVIKHVPAKGVLLVRSNLDLPIKCGPIYIRDKRGYEELYGLGYVENVAGKATSPLLGLRDDSFNCLRDGFGDRRDD